MPKVKQVNLLPQDEFEISTLGRILKWALGTFRIMVIVTELIVMSAFLSRFWLDAKNSDLNEEVEINKNQILAYSDVESQLKSYQKRLLLAKQLFSQNKKSESLFFISNLLPIDVSLSSISLKMDGELIVKGVSFSEKSILKFLINLQGSDKVESASLTQIASDSENVSLTNFIIFGKVK